MTSFTIQLPIPPATLSPNSRAHWAVRARATKDERWWSCAVTRKTWLDKASGPLPHWKSATERTTFYFGDKRRRDKDNFAARCKAIFDGVVDAGLLADDCGLSHLPAEFVIDKEKAGCMEIEFTRGTI